MRRITVVRLAALAIALSARAGGAQGIDAPLDDTHRPTWGIAGTKPATNLPMAVLIGDTARGPSRRSTLAGGIVGGLIGGLAVAGYVLNATAYDCVTIGPPCPKKNYVFLHTVTITAGVTAGAFLGVKVAHWVSRRMSGREGRSMVTSAPSSPRRRA